MKRCYLNRETRKDDLKRLSRYASSLLGLTRRTVLSKYGTAIVKIGCSDSLNTVFARASFCAPLYATPRQAISLVDSIRVVLFLIIPVS